MSKKFEFYLTTEIAPDGEKFNSDTWEWEPVESHTSQMYFVKNLADAKDDDDVVLYINSVGGSVKEALGIYNVLKRCPAKVTAYIDGYAASAASIIAMAADEVIMPRNTCMMIHNASWWTYGTPSQLRKSADDLDVINQSAIESYLVKAGDKLDEVTLRRFLDAETWLTAAECLEYGLADTLADISATSQTPIQKYEAAASSCVHYPAAKITLDVAAKLSSKKPMPSSNLGVQRPGAGGKCPELGQPKEHEYQPEAAVTHGVAYALLENMNL